MFAGLSVFIYLSMYLCFYSLHDIFLNCLHVETSNASPKNKCVIYIIAKNEIVSKQILNK